MLSLRGKEVKPEQALALGQQISLSLDGLSPGFYLVKFETENLVGFRKIQVF